MVVEMAVVLVVMMHAKVEESMGKLVPKDPRYREIIEFRGRYLRHSYIPGTWCISWIIRIIAWPTRTIATTTARLWCGRCGW